MKILLPFFIIIVSFSCANVYGQDAPKVKLPDELITTDGKKYEHVKLLEVKDEGISIMHSNGVDLIPYSVLSPDIQKACNYDPKKAELAETAYQKQITEQANPTISLDDLKDKAFERFSAIMHQLDGKTPVSEWKQNGAVMEVTMKNEFLYLPYDVRLQFAQTLTKGWAQLYPDGITDLYDASGNQIGGNGLFGVWVTK